MTHRRHHRRITAVVAVVALAGCGVDNSIDGGVDGRHHHDGLEAGALTAEVAMTGASLQQLDGVAVFSAEGPAIVACGAGGLITEGDLLEVRTGFCDPADVGAALPTDLPVGTSLTFTLSHSVLVADGGEAHIAVFVGDELAVEIEKPLPAAAAFLSPRVVLQQAHVAGERVVVHVHNHGSNTYLVHGLVFGPPAP